MKRRALASPRPLPRIARFEKLAFGLFIHWGLYSQLGRGEWVRARGRFPEYDHLFGRFDARDYDPRALARLARTSGMRYASLTTRHHDGFSLYDTRGLSTYDAPHTPAGRDLVAEFADACRAEGVVPCFYHTLLDWSFDTANCSPRKFARYLDYLNASIEILCTHYGAVGGFFFDGTWSRTDLDWDEDRLYGTIRRLQPEAVIVNNTGLHARGAAGHPELDSVTYEQGLPRPLDRRGADKYLAIEMNQPMNAHWGIGFRDVNFKSPAEIIENLCLSRKVRANYLLNVGPTATGAIPAYEAAALGHVGRWIELSGAPIYDGRPVACQCQGRDFILRARGRLYYFCFGLGLTGDSNVVVGQGSAGPRAVKGLKQRIRQARWLDNGEELAVAQNSRAGLAVIDFTGYPYGTHLVVRVAELR